MSTCQCSARAECKHGERPGNYCPHCDKQITHGGDCPRSVGRARRVAKRRAKKAAR